MREPKALYPAAVLMLAGLILALNVSRWFAVLLGLGAVLFVVLMIREMRRIQARNNGAVPIDWRWWLVGMVSSTLMGGGIAVALDTDAFQLGWSLSLVGVAGFLAFVIREWIVNERAYRELKEDVARLQADAHARDGADGAD